MGHNPDPSGGGRADPLVQLALQAQFDISPASMRILDFRGHIVRTNAVAQQDHPDGPVTTLRELWEHDAPVDVETAAKVPFLASPGMLALAGQTVGGQVLEVRRRGVVKDIITFSLPLFGADGEVVGALLQDLDERVRVHLQGRMDTMEEARRKRLESDVEDARIHRLVEERSRALVIASEEQMRERRLAAVGQLAAGVMHDVNNALNPIMAAAYLLRLHADDPEAVRDYADRIQKAAEIGAATASRVGRFIRQEPLHTGHDVEVDLSLLVGEVLDLTEPMRLKRSSQSRVIALTTEFGEAVLTRGLPGEIREALLNLVQNALDAMPDGGTLTLRTFRHGSQSCVAVRDTGVGMPPEVRERAFEPFFTTKGSRGSGLGLAEVYGMARRHRGTVDITSAPEQGTEVTLGFLAADPTAFVAKQGVEPAVISLRVLIVEDHDDGREFLRRILEGAGHAVEAVGSCTDARAHLAVGRGRYDLLLTDVGLPDGTGWSLVREAHEHLSELRIGVLTGWEAQADSGDRQFADFVLRKPLRAAELLAQIAGIASGVASGKAAGPITSAHPSQ